VHGLLVTSSSASLGELPLSGPGVCTTRRPPADPRRFVALADDAPLHPADARGRLRPAAGTSETRPPWLRRLRLEFQWFFTELSVRPGSSLAIWAHLLPNSLCAAMILFSCAHADSQIPRHAEGHGRI
jgi:hypothetical protein